MQGERDEERDKIRADALALLCPVCNFFFISWEVRSFGYETRRTDFRPNYPGENPMNLYYHFCPKCKYCADQEYYRLELPWEKRQALQNGLEELYGKHGNGINESVAGKLYYGARVAELLNDLGLTKEPAFDRIQSFIQPFWWSGPKELEKYGEVALQRLAEALRSMDTASEDYLYLVYMAGEISRRLGKAAEARVHFEKLLALRKQRQNESNRFLFELAHQQMTSPKEILLEESLNPFARR